LFQIETLGKRIKFERLRNKMSKTELSMLTQMSRSYITELEEDKYSNPSLRVLCALCKALRCTPNDLTPEEFYK